MKDDDLLIIHNDNKKYKRLLFSSVFLLYSALFVFLSWVWVRMWEFFVLLIIMASFPLIQMWSFYLDNNKREAYNEEEGNMVFFFTSFVRCLFFSTVMTLLFVKIFHMSTFTYNTKVIGNNNPLRSLLYGIITVRIHISHEKLTSLLLFEVYFFTSVYFE